MTFSDESAKMSTKGQRLQIGQKRAKGTTNLAQMVAKGSPKQAVLGPGLSFFRAKVLPKGQVPFHLFRGAKGLKLFSTVQEKTG